MLLPRTKWVDDLDGANAKNNAFRVKMKRGLEYSRAIWAQEFYESRLKLSPHYYLGLLFEKEYKNHMEVFSHEIEVQQAVLDGAFEHSYRLDEAEIMWHGYDGRFQRSDYYSSMGKIYESMLYVREDAVDFVTYHQDKIRKYGTEK